MSNPTESVPAPVPAPVPASAPEHVPAPVPVLVPILVDEEIQHFPVWHLGIIGRDHKSGPASYCDEYDATTIFADTAHMNARTALMIIRCGEACQLFGIAPYRQVHYLRQVYTETLRAIRANMRENIVHMTMCINRLPIPTDTARMIAEMASEQSAIFFGRYSHYHIINRRLRVLIKNTSAADMVPRP